jgi:hypothetical protein
VSEWIRPAEGGLWHRYSRLQDADPIELGGLTFLCGDFLVARDGWTTAVPELVPQDDQHAPCMERAKREAYWHDRFVEAPKQPLPWMVRDLALEIYPGLQNVIVTPHHHDAEPRHRFERLELRAANLDGVVIAAGRSFALAAGELLAAVEIGIRPG